MRLKAGVVLSVCASLARKLSVIEGVVAHVCDQELTITSGGDGKHMVGSRHYTGEAIDIRSRDMSEVQKKRVVAMLVAVLGSDFDVVLEKDHIHIEFHPE